MFCPKCKNELKDNSLKCEHCGTKIGSLCTECGSYNLINAKKCEKCGKILIKICDSCGAANRPDATECRKCKTAFTGTNTDNEIMDFPTNPRYSQSNTQQKIKAKLIDAIENVDCKIITISGDSGSGKNLIINSAISELKNANLLWLYGNCSQTSQLSPFGFFQEILLLFFNINNFCPDTLQLKKNSVKFFKQDFPNLTNEEIHDLLNILYPDLIDKYENIYFNKAKTFNLMKKVIFTIVEKIKTVFIIDNFEYIDGMSYEFLKELFNDDFILSKCKIILVQNEPKPGLGLLNIPNSDVNNYTDLVVAPFSQAQIETFIKQQSGLKVSKDFINETAKISQGNPALIEQVILLNKDIKRTGIRNADYNSIENIIELRLNILREEDLRAYRMLTALSVLGNYFYPAILENFDNNTPQEFERIIKKLIDLGFINRVSNLSFEFKSKTIWKHVVSIIKNSEYFEEILNILLENMEMYKHSSIALLAYIVQKLNNNDHAFEIWTLLMKQASYIGDISLYIIAQKQAYKLIENKSSEFFLNVKRNINTRVGKLLEPIDYKAAFPYLQNAIMMLDGNNEFEHIELLGYLASCSMKDGNYCGAIECADSVLNKLPENAAFEKILIKSRQIKPQLKLGSYGQLINTVENEILPEFEKVLSKGKESGLIKLDTLFRMWIEIYFDLAEALVFQGDLRAFDTIRTIYDILDKNKAHDQSLLCKTHLLLALANTIKGDIQASNKILDDILKEYQLDNLDSFIVSRWNLIDILNKFFAKDYAKIHNELFNVVAYANNNNDRFTKNILKTILAKILKNNNQTKKALEILEEQVSYFAKEKVSTGVLLSWYLIAEIKLITNGTQFALDIATKALDVAQNPGINNFYFIALFNKLISEIYLAKQDFDSAQTYAEKAIFIAKQFDLEYILVKSYLQFAKIFQELALPKTNQRSEYVKQALKLFQFAKNVPIVSDNTFLQKAIKEDLNVLTSFCKLNSIVLKKI